MPKIEKSFNHKECELKHYNFWLENKFFHADENSEKPPFSIVIPPPNVTGSLHIGHALDNTLQDIIVRYMRMRGFNALWMPGTDHAGIATQHVVEKQLLAEGIDRHKLGREKFIERTWKWKEKAGGKILEQLKRLGASCDWDRTRFTLDEGLSKAVRKVFVDLYNEGLIYRDNYIINWCPSCLTALSDIEVEQEEKAGKLYYIKYTSADGKFSLTVATTRPETMLGDTAVAVNPNDKKYSAFIGKELILPLLKKKIPVIADEKVEMDFGTGALKITPAHDFNDFEIGKKHGLESVNVFTKDGKLNENAGKYKGLEILAARKAVIKDLESEGLLQKIDDYKLIIGSCYRCKSLVEPRLSKQWFVKTKPLAKPAIKAVKEGKTKIIPKAWEKTYFDWMENIRDWCISRQLWWGHRIPAFYCADCNKVIVEMKDPKSCPQCKSADLSQDADVLDTWFSSALWPFSTMGWPEKTKEVDKFYPTSLLITGFDIIFFWVARMMMMGIKFMNDVPFKHTFIHALIRDEYGKKMSKSKGNVVDPLDIMDKFGTDAFRFTLGILTVQGRDISLSEKRIVGYRNFVNKLWNASKFILNSLEKDKIDLNNIDNIKTQPEDKWIRTRLNEVIDSINSSFEKYKFNDICTTLYKFVWHEFCDWYIEFSKRRFYKGKDDEKTAVNTTLVYVLDRLLKLLHPVMPFVTEEIWRNIPEKHDKAKSIMISNFPLNDGFNDKKAYENIEFIKDVIAAIRNMRTENLIAPQKKIEIIFNSNEKSALKKIDSLKELIIELAGCEKINFSQKPPKLIAKSLVKGVEIIFPIEGLVDVKQEKERLAKEIAKASKDVEFFEKRLANKGFVKNASEELIEENRQSLKETGEKLKKFKESFERLKEFDA